MPSYIATYVVAGDKISVSTDGTQILSSLMGKKAYLYISTSNSSYSVIDLTLYMTHEKSINYTQSLSTLANSLTDLQINGYKSTDIPFVDQVTEAFDYRLNVYDANAASDVTVSWTSLETPGVRNDIYQRDQMNDLVLSSNTKDFSNCLVAVNGVFHNTYFFDKELYVEGGFSNIKTAQKNRIAVYDTSSLGGHLIVPFTEDNIDNSNNTPFSGVTLTFPNTDFTGTTVLLVIGGYLYALDDTYRLINKNRLMIDFCKIDLIDQIIQDPNTTYTIQNNDAIAAATQAPQVPNVVDEITYYLQSVYPSASENVIKQVNLLNFTAYNTTVSTPDPQTMIEDFLLNYPYKIPTATNVLLSEYQPYQVPNNIYIYLPISRFTDPRLVYALLLQSNSFLVVIKNPKIYKRIYELNKTQLQSQYVAYSSGDTPRGILQYNKNRTLPYLTYAESNNLNYNFSIDYSKIYKDVYKTAINPISVPSPTVDVRHDSDYPVRLLELYSPAN